MSTKMEITKKRTTKKTTAKAGKGKISGGKLKLFMDTHNKIKSITDKNMSAGHKKDLNVQGEYDVEYVKYWYDKKTGRVHCLVRAKSKKLAEEVHRQSHGNVADVIVEVVEGN